MYVNDAFRDYYYKPARSRLRGLARNPAISGALLRRLVDEQFKEVRVHLGDRREWTDEQFDALAGHPDPEVRAELAEALHANRAFKVLLALATGPDPFDLPIAEREPMLPLWAYERLIERDSRPGGAIADSRWGTAGSSRAAVTAGRRNHGARGRAAAGPFRS